MAKKGLMILLDAYQKSMVKHILNNQYCALFVKMGYGKTRATLEAISILKMMGEIEKVLIVAPGAVANYVWKQETDKWNYNFRFINLNTTNENGRRFKKSQKKADIYIITPDLLFWLVKETLFDYDMIIYDEMSMFKNANSKRFKSAKYIKIKSTKVKRIVGLTGTPASNSLHDLFAEMYIIDGGERLGKTLGAFREEFFKPISFRGMYFITKWIPRESKKSKLYAAIQDIVFSLHKEILKLEVNIIPVIIPWGNARVELNYKKLKKDMVVELEKNIIDGKNSQVVAYKLAQYCNGNIYNENKEVIRIHKYKIEALKYIVERANENILVFYWFIHDRDSILKEFCEAQTIVVEKWNSREQKLALAHPASMGHGLNLQDGGRIIVFYSPIFSLELYQQAIARLARRGQKEKVLVYVLAMQDSIDEKIICVLQDKNATQEALLKAIEKDILK